MHHSGKLQFPIPTQALLSDCSDLVPAPTSANSHSSDATSMRLREGAKVLKVPYQAPALFAWTGNAAHPAAHVDKLLLRSTGCWLCYSRDTKLGSAGKMKY